MEQITMETLIEKIESFHKENIWLDSSLEVVESVPTVATMGIRSIHELMSSVANLSNNIKLNIAWKCINAELNTEQSINVIYNYVSNPKRAFYITNEFRKIMLSNSVNAVSIIAIILGRVIKEDRECTYEEMVIANTLSSMTDYDLDNFIYAYDNCIVEVGERRIIAIDAVKDIPMENIRATMQICVSNGLVIQESAFMDGETFNAGGFFMATSFCDKLMEYVKYVKQIFRYE